MNEDVLDRNRTWVRVPHVSLILTHETHQVGQEPSEQDLVESVHLAVLFHGAAVFEVVELDSLILHKDFRAITRNEEGEHKQASVVDSHDELLVLLVASKHDQFVLPVTHSVVKVAKEWKLFFLARTLE